MEYKVIESSKEEKEKLLNTLKVEAFSSKFRSIYGNESTIFNDDEFSDDTEIENLEADVISIVDEIGGNRNALRWVLAPQNRTRLLVNNKPFIAKEISYKYGKISWKTNSGNHFPLFEFPCPKNTHKGLYYIRGFFGGITARACRTHGYAKGYHPTSVYWGVADDKYRDNVGYFELIITGWS